MKQYSCILVTGGAGFVGSNLAIRMRQRYPDARIVVADNLKRRGSEFNLARLSANRIEFVHADVRNVDDLAFPGIAFDLMLECSAEPSVLAGFDAGPTYLINTNLMGTVNCLEVARRSSADVVFFSTSRVYPDRSAGVGRRLGGGHTLRAVCWADAAGRKFLGDRRRISA